MKILAILCTVLIFSKTAFAGAYGFNCHSINENDGSKVIIERSTIVVIKDNQILVNGEWNSSVEDFFMSQDKEEMSDPYAAVSIQSNSKRKIVSEIASQTDCGDDKLEKIFIQDFSIKSLLGGSQIIDTKLECRAYYEAGHCIGE